MIRLLYKPVSMLVSVLGAIFAVVKAALERSGAEGTRKLTGLWPGEEGQPSGEEA